MKLVKVLSLVLVVQGMLLGSVLGSVFESKEGHILDLAGKLDMIEEMNREMDALVFDGINPFSKQEIQFGWTRMLNEVRVDMALSVEYEQIVRGKAVLLEADLISEKIDELQKLERIANFLNHKQVSEARVIIDLALKHSINIKDDNGYTLAQYLVYSERVVEGLNLANKSEEGIDSALLELKNEKGYTPLLITSIP